MRGFYDRFTNAAVRSGDRTAVEVQRRDGLETWTYERLHARAETLAAFLHSRGVAKGDRCALLSENDAHWCAAYLGMLRLGAVPVPLDTSYTAAQVDKLTADCEARLILVSPRFSETVPPNENARCPSFQLTDRLGAVAGELPDVEIAPDDPAAILYTSGTTSDPKGVVLTHANLFGEIDAALDVVTIDESDAILGVLPLFHALAQLANLLLPLTVGARVVFLETVSSSDLMRTLHEREITTFCCVPQFFYLVHERILDQVSKAGRPKRLVFKLLLRTSGFLRERLGINLGPYLFSRVHRALGKHMRLLVTGGSRMDPRVGKDLYRLGFNIIQAYGLTESCGAVTSLRPGDPHVESVGQAFLDTEIKILPSEAVAEAGEDASGNPVRIGEVLARGPMISPGYFRRDDANAVTFRDGWLHTGDLGYLDSEGRLYITGRAKDVIVLGSGKNIHPEEIEAHYEQSAYIKELCVMGRTPEGEPASERLHAVIVPDFDVLRKQKIFNSRDILRFEVESQSSRLPGHKRIMSYDIVTDDLPRTTTRKLKRFEIERRLGELRTEEAVAPALDLGSHDGDDAWVADPHVAKALDVLRGMTQIPGRIGRSSNLELDIGLDSMGRVELITALEVRFGVSVPDEVAHDIHTIGELVDAFRVAGDAPADDPAGAFDPWRNLLEDVSNDAPAVESMLVQRPLMTLITFAVSRVVFAIAWLLMGLRVSGREHLPAQGPFLISPNHQSFLDAFLLASVLPYRVSRNVFYVGASEYFSTPLLAWIARMIHVVPVDPDTNLVRAMRAGALGLRRGKVLILFPEGERSIDAEIKTFKKGATILSLKVGAPIVPVALDGMFDIWPRDRPPRFSRLFPFSGSRVHIRFGPALEPVLAERHTEDEYTSVTQELRGAVGALLSDLRGGRASATSPPP